MRSKLAISAILAIAFLFTWNLSATQADHHKGRSTGVFQKSQRSALAIIRGSGFVFSKTNNFYYIGTDSSVLRNANGVRYSYFPSRFYVNGRASNLFRPELVYDNGQFAVLRIAVDWFDRNNFPHPHVLSFAQRNFVPKVGSTYFITGQRSYIKGGKTFFYNNSYSGRVRVSNRNFVVCSIGGYRGLRGAAVLDRFGNIIAIQGASGKACISHNQLLNFLIQQRYKRNFIRRNQINIQHGNTRGSY